jgi:hypothetical protein
VEDDNGDDDDDDDGSSCICVTDSVVDDDSLSDDSSFNSSVVSSSVLAVTDLDSSLSCFGVERRIHASSEDGGWKLPSIYPTPTLSLTPPPPHTPSHTPSAVNDGFFFGSVSV